MQVISNKQLSVVNNTITCTTLIPTQLQSRTLDNYYNILLDAPTSEAGKEDNKTVITLNRSNKHECDQATITTADLTEDDISSDDEPPGTHHKSPEYAILDSGAMAHFIIKGATVRNKLPTSNPLKIKLPDGSVIKSTHTCNLDIPWLPNSVTEAHIVPGLTHSSLVATKKFCDAGCKIMFDKNGCKIIYKSPHRNQGSIIRTMEGPYQPNIHRYHLEPL